MMKQKLNVYLFVASVVLSITTDAYGQVTSEGSMVLQSPQVWNFIKYGDQGSVDMYTGALGVSIPFYTYKDEDFEIPISVGYGSNGYKPNIQTGILGLGWFLNVGGCITREVRDLPDDTSKIISSSSYHRDLCQHHSEHPEEADPFDSCPCNAMDKGHDFRGYLEYYEMNDRSGYSPSSQINLPFAFMQHYNSRLPYGLDKAYETLTDVYHFQFGKHKGSFCFDANTKSIHVFNSTQAHGQYKISYSKYADGKFATFTFITGDGCKYTFGGSFQHDLDYTDYNWNEPGHPRIDYHLTWMLKEIVAPNKRKVIFNYYETTDYGVARPIAWTNQNERPGLSSPDLEEGAIRSLIVAYNQKGINLKEIVIDGQITIAFDIGGKNAESSYPSGFLQNMGQLNSIAVKTNEPTSRLVKKCEFTYSNSNNTSSKIQFLRNMNVSGEGEYVFSYYDENAQYPKHGTVAIDHWGYYNRKESYYAPELLPLVAVDADYNELITSDNKEPDFIGSRMGMLARIQYPTGGATSYEYEGNTYTRKVIRNFTTNCVPQLGNANVGGYNYPKQTEYPAGGVRVKKIIDSMSQNEKRTRVYKYENPDHTGSGILLNYPRYKTTVKLSIGGYLKNHPIIDYRYGNVVNYTIDNTHISYPSVQEYFSDLSHAEYQFISYADVVDSFPSTIEQGMIGDGQVILSGLAGGDALFRETSSHHIIRGKMKSKFMYGSGGGLIQKQIYRYDEGSGNLYGTKHTLSHFYNHNLVLYHGLLLSVQTTTYNGTSPVTLSVNYDYNVYGQFCGEEYSRGGSTYGTRIVYPGALYVPDIFKAQFSYKYMLSNNFLNFPLLEYSLNDGKVNSIIKHDYYPDGSAQNLCVKQKKISKSEFTSPIDINTPYSGSWFSSEVNFDLYDYAGHLLQTTDKAGLQTVYLWGYGGLHLIAKIENANVGVIKQINGFSEIERGALLSGLGSLESELRTSLPNAYITTYEWTPYVGLTKMKDPSGVSTNYQYDEHGRLIAIRDESNDAMQRFEYSQN